MADRYSAMDDQAQERSEVVVFTETQQEANLLTTRETCVHSDAPASQSTCFACCQQSKGIILVNHEDPSLPTSSSVLHKKSERRSRGQVSMHKIKSCVLDAGYLRVRKSGDSSVSSHKMINCILNGRMISCCGNSTGGRDDHGSHEFDLRWKRVIQIFIPYPAPGARFLHDELQQHVSTLVEGAPLECWALDRLESPGSDLGSDLYVSQRLDDLVWISGNPDDGSPSDGDRTSKGDTSSVALHQCVSFVGRRGRKAAKPWRGRLKSRSASYLQFLQRFPPSPTVFSGLTLYDEKVYSPQDGFRNDSQGRVSWVDLHGRLMNADSATSVMEIGGKLGEQEKFVWESLCPLQRVLVVAVAAAAASAAKEKNANEVLRLQRVIRKRESDLVLMREELGNLLNQVDSQRSQLHIDQGEPRPSDSLDELVDLLSQVDIQHCHSDSEELDPIFSICPADNVGELSTNVDLQVSESTPPVNRILNFSDLTKKISPIKEESPSSGGPGLDLVEKMRMSNSWIESLDIGLLIEEAAGQQDYLFGQESVNKNVVFEQHASVQSISGPEEKESIAFSAEGERNGNSVVYDISKDNGNAVEWLSETSSVIMDPFSPMPSEKQRGYRSEGAEDCSKDWWRKSVVQEKSFASRARCASILLDVKKQVISLLDEAASNVLEALTFISEKARQLEEKDDALTPQKVEESWNKRYPVSSIKDSVNKASMRIATLQTAMVRIWESLGPEAMSALDISPTDFDDYLTNLQIAKILNEDACDLSAGSISIDSWREWFRRGFDNPESSFLRKIQVSVGNEQETPNGIQVSENIEHRSDWPPSGSIYPFRKSGMKNEQISPANISARQKVEKLMGPLFESKEADETTEKTPNLVTVAEELVAEFERSAAKVASLKKYVKACDIKRKQVERKLLEAWEQDSKNQVKSSNEVMELKRQVRLKETAYQQLISSRKALVSSKTKEISELREDCRRHNITLQDMAAAAKATQESSEKRLAMLEEICRKKDNSIVSLKQEIFELESKLQELQPCQTPAQLRPMNLPPTERETDTESTDDVFDNENSYRLFGDDCQLRSSYQSMCGSENRRTSWGSDLSAQEFHIIDTPWSSELTAGQDFNVIEEAAFQGRSLSIFQNVTSSQEFLRGSLRRLGSTPGGGLDPNNGEDPDTRPNVNPHLEARKENNGYMVMPNYRKELSKSATGIPANTSLVTTRSKRRDDKLRASTGVLSAVGPNTPFKPRRSSTAVTKEGSRSQSAPLNGTKPKENATRGRQKWV